MSELDVPVPAALQRVFRPPPSRNGIRLQLPAPWCEEQRLLIHSRAQIIVMAAGTKVGKTFGCGECATVKTSEAPREQMGLFRIVAPTYAKARLTYDYVDRWFLPEKLPPQKGPDGKPIQGRTWFEMQRAWESFTPDRSRHEMWLRWRHNLATLACMHGQTPEVTIEGDATQGNILDEAAKMRPNVLSSVMSTTSQTGGWIRQVSTPLGLGHFYESWRKAKEVMDWELKKGLTLDECTHLALNLPSTKSPFVKPHVIEAARRFLPGRIFEQLYLAQFRADGNVFQNLDACFGNAMEYEDVEAYMPASVDSDTLFVAADIAQTKDYCVFLAFTAERRMVAWKRFNKVEYLTVASMFDEWIETLRVRCRDRRGRVLARYDETGMKAFGDILRARPRHEDVTLDGITWNKANKREAIENLMLMFEEAALDLLPWRTLQHELSVFEVSTNKMGEPQYGAPAGDHDDTVMALALIHDLLRDVRGENWVVERVDAFDVRLAHFERTGQTDEIEDLLD